MQDMSKQYARMLYQYRYTMQNCPDSPLWSRDGNIGDPVQSLAAENIYVKMGIKEKSRILLVNRDDISTYLGEPCCLAMQACLAPPCRYFSIAMER
jgi:hypothetical protein